VGAFVADQLAVPYAINNDGVLSRNAAEALFRSLEEERSAGAQERASADAGIFVLELGIGVGLFARFFLDAFKELCAQHDKDYYRRLVYIAGDRSERMLADACRRGVLADHGGHCVFRVVDALEPGRYLLNDSALPADDPRPLRAVFLNYVIDCLPAADLKVEDHEVRQLCVRTCLARNVDLGEFTTLTPEELARRAASKSSADQDVLQKLYGLLASEYDYRTVEGSGDRGQEPGGIRYLDFAVEFAREHPGHVLHNYGAIQCLERLLGLLRPSGFILINDYGHVEGAPEGDFEHQRFSKATSVGLNFPLLKAFFGEGRGSADGGRGNGGVTPGQDGLEIRPTGSCGSPGHSSLATHHSPLMWLEPEEDAGHIYSRLLGHAPHAERDGYGVGPATVRFFKERFSKGAVEWVQKPFQLARANLQAGRFEAALAAYHEALQRQPYNWLLMNEIALFLTFTLRNAPAGIAMARAALALNPASSAELWNTLGDAFFEFGKVPEAKDAYRRALRISRDDVRARYNLSWVYLVERDYAAALAVIAEALALDETGEYQERLMKKQAEVLGRLAFRNQQKLLLLANRVSKKADSDGVVGAPPVASRKEGPQVQGAGDRAQGSGDRGQAGVGG
jgi:hypothetical protein